MSQKRHAPKLNLKVRFSNGGFESLKSKYNVRSLLTFFFSSKAAVEREVSKRLGDQHDKLRQTEQRLKEEYQQQVKDLFQHKI